MKFIVDKQIFSDFPAFKIGVLVIKDFDNTGRSSSVEALLRGIAAQQYKKFQNQNFEEEKTVKAWLETFKQKKINTKKYPPSIVALLRRIVAGKELPHVNLLVDIYNYFSLKYLLPIGGEDLDKLYDDLYLTYTEGGEVFRPLGTIDIKKASEGEPAYIDQGGITCRYWNYRECHRTRFTAETKNAAIFIEDQSNVSNAEFTKMLTDFQQSVQKYLGVNAEVQIIDRNNQEIDFDIKGLEKAKDDFIPPKELEEFQKKIVKKPKSKPVHPKTGKKKKSILEVSDDHLVKGKIRQLVKESVKANWPDLEPEIVIEYPASVDHGDYACNIAMRLSKALKVKPHEIAATIIESMPDNDLIDEIEVAGPGFINFFLSEEVLNKNLIKIFKEKDNFGYQEVGENRKIVVEYSSPNIAKPMGIHHILTTIIGQSIYDILEAVGFETVSVNHIGDWGTQFGKVIYALKTWGDKTKVEKDPINELLALYVDFHKRAEQDSSLEDHGRAEFKKLEDGDSENTELWKWVVEKSMEDMQKTYDKLGHMHFDHTLGEAFYSDKMDEIFEIGKKAGIIVEGENGAQVIHFEEEGLPTVPIRKSDGATLYITRDFATLKYRVDQWKPEKILYVVGAPQSLHFQQLFAAGKRMNICGDQPEHISFGRMSLKDKKMSTRKGEIVLLDSVLDEAIERAKEIILEKNPELENVDQVAKIIGVGAAKYAILSQNRNTDIVFDWEKIMSFEGNSGPYLQYTYARSRSLDRKAKEVKADKNDLFEDPDNSADICLNLKRKLIKYPEILLQAAKEYKPNLLATYVYELAQEFNSFYNHVPVLKAENSQKRELRLELSRACSQVIKNCLNLLGIDTVEQM
jgi:arginyl-tRNA synthetase